LLTPRKIRKKFRAPVHNPSVVLLWVQTVWLQVCPSHAASGSWIGVLLRI
jgi:hypothetical protein